MSLCPESYSVNVPHRIFLLLASTLFCHQMSLAQTAPSTAWHDPSPHRSEMITVEQGVQLEVWTGEAPGRALVFLSGSGILRTFGIILLPSSPAITTSTPSRGADSGDRHTPGLATLRRDSLTTFWP